MFTQEERKIPTGFVVSTQTQSLYHFKTQHPVWVNNSGSACAATIVFDLETQLCWDQQFGADQSLWREEKNTFINVKYQI